MNTAATINGIATPDSLLVRKASALVEQVHNKALLNHVHRTWWFGELIGAKQGLKYDRELLCLAALLHDLGLTRDYAGDQRFEVDGADAARRFLKEHDYPQSKAELVWDAVALHTSLGIADRKQPEIALVCIGAHADLFGLGLDHLTPDLIDAVIALYPRVGIKAAFTEAIAEQVRKKPHTAASPGLIDIGRRHVNGFAPPNICDLIDNAPFDS